MAAKRARTNPPDPSRSHDVARKRESRKGALLAKVEREAEALLDENLPDAARRHVARVVRAVRSELERKQERAGPKRERRVRGNRGRPPINAGIAMERQIAVRLRDDVVTRLEEIASTLGVSAASVARVLIAQGLGLSTPKRSATTVARTLRPLLDG